MREVFSSTTHAQPEHEIFRQVKMFDRRELKILQMKDEKRKWLELEGYQIWKRMKEERKFAKLSLY